jgi:hypothetical protein
MYVFLPFSTTLTKYIDNGWLESFGRQQIVFNSLLKLEIFVEKLLDWPAKLFSVIYRYDPKEIGNDDEIGLFFHALSSKTLFKR